ncbi:Na+/H+ antiporter family protein [Echinimonas agarilytica]|uniref:Na+/H+ antiporter family protein n=1 Tax=Echinimonas agarilytica TaxID=1215918 RepID=A0AA41W6L9_9GAMM|nr:Na+/H+ antiporter family protein [Echinimonas agarilytica]MCM2679872.1 Na+/H+ antiporter family protein [Echinimonas agarilytica]
MNAVIIAVVLMLGLSLLRINVVIALTVSAIVAGVSAGLPLPDTIKAFEKGLGGGATIALGYAMLGAFAVALSRSGITIWLAHSIISKLGHEPTAKQSAVVEALMLFALLIMAVMSQNVIPVHIAFIPILVPPLLRIMSSFQLDRRLVACVLTFGLVTPYMLLPIGFGSIFLNDILLANLTNNGLEANANMVMPAMALPALGMVCGLLVAIFISYRKPRVYASTDIHEDKLVLPSFKQRMIALASIVITLVVQLYTGSIILGALAGVAVFTLTGLVKWNETHDVFYGGLKLMAMIGFIMIAASGFAEVVKATGHVDTLVAGLTEQFAGNQAVAAFAMLVVGLLITMGIGSSFSTIPIIATLYVPLCIGLEFSVPATIALVGTAAALGDAGSPASDSTLGPTSGLNADGQHDHIWDTVVPTFVHYNLPLMAAGWLAAISL